MITTEELARMRAIAEADKNGADGKAWDEAITPDIVIALCDRIENSRTRLISLTWHFPQFAVPWSDTNEHIKRRARPMARKAVITIHML